MASESPLKWAGFLLDQSLFWSLPFWQKMFWAWTPYTFPPWALEWIFQQGYCMCNSLLLSVLSPQWWLFSSPLLGFITCLLPMLPCHSAWAPFLLGLGLTPCQVTPPKPLSCWLDFATLHWATPLCSHFPYLLGLWHPLTWSSPCVDAILTLLSLQNFTQGHRGSPYLTVSW